jgi:hypothetical protein
VRSNFESLLDIIDSEKNRTPRNALEDSDGDDDDDSDDDDETEGGLRSSAQAQAHTPDWGDGSDAVLRSWLVALGLPDPEAAHCAAVLHSSDRYGGGGGGYKSPLDLAGVERAHLKATLDHLEDTDIDMICAGVGALKTGGFDVLLRKLVESPRLGIPAEAAVRYLCLFKADG